MVNLGGTVSASDGGIDTIAVDVVAAATEGFCCMSRVVVVCLGIIVDLLLRSVATVCIGSVPVVTIVGDLMPTCDGG